MQVVIGGAYNGKRTYVKKALAPIAQGHLSFFEGELPNSHYSKEDYLIIGNFEKLIEPMLELDEVEIADRIVKRLKSMDSTANVVCICTDIGRGIVPMDAVQRKIRDTCGRLYQRLFEESETVVRIWYGIPQYLKGSIDDESTEN